MKTALIWDLDGTLIDSYPVIVASLVALCAEVGFSCIEDEVEHLVKSQSVSALLARISGQTGRLVSALKEQYSQISRTKDGEIELLPHAAEVLQALAAQSCCHYIYTHRGASTLPILEALGLAPFFSDLVTAEDGFPRKPDPSALLHLMKKHGLNPESSYYIGDRDLDVACGKNAGIGTVLLASAYAKAQADWKINRLNELLEIF